MIVVFVLLAFSLAHSAHAGDQPSATEQVVLLETFEAYAPQAFPKEWKVRGNEEEARLVYRVTEENGNRFLHARAEKQGVQIGLSRTFPPQQFPVLRWRWRVKTLPSGADERALPTNDSAAGVYVVFDSTIVPRAIKYVWSASLPVGTRMNSPTYWRAKVVVLESGANEAGEWRSEVVNFYEDYKKLFGFEPSEVEGVALLTDSDTTATVAEADYDDFMLLTANAASNLRVNGATALLSMPDLISK